MLFLDIENELKKHFAEEAELAKNNPTDLNAEVDGEEGAAGEAGDGAAEGDKQSGDAAPANAEKDELFTLDDVPSLSLEKAKVIIEGLEEEMGLSIPTEELDAQNYQSLLDELDKREAMLEANLRTMITAVGDGGISEQAYNGMIIQIADNCGVAGHVFTQMATESFKSEGGKVKVANYAAEDIKKGLEAALKTAKKFFMSLKDAAIKVFKRHFTNVGRFTKKVENLEAAAGQIQGSVEPGTSFDVPKNMMLQGKVATIIDLKNMIKPLRKLRDTRKTASIKQVGDAYKSFAVDGDAAVEAGKQELLRAYNDIANNISNAMNARFTADADKGKEAKLRWVATDLMVGNRFLSIGVAGDGQMLPPSVVIGKATDTKDEKGEASAYTTREIQEVCKIMRELLKMAEDMSDTASMAEAEKAFKEAEGLAARGKGADNLGSEAQLTLRSSVKMAKSLARLAREPEATMVAYLMEVCTAYYNHALKSAKAHK